MAYISPLYIVLILAIALCVFFFWIGTVCVRLWFYKGALGPEPEKFVILRKDLKSRYRKSVFAGDYEEQDTNTSKRTTVFPSVASPTTALDPRRFSTLPTINIQDADDLEEFEDPKLRAYVAEECRISRLPAFVQDDCGDGSDFPDIPIALEPIEEHHLGISQPFAPESSVDYMSLGLKKVEYNSWLTVSSKYIEHHSLRASLLSKNKRECIRVTQDGEAACEELLQEVVAFLVAKYPHHFSIRIKGRRRHVRNELTQEEYSLVRPYDHDPLEVCARLAMEDFQVLVKGEFTMQWYLQASATMFPAGWRMQKHIGKSVDAIINNRHEPMPLWEEFPDILNLPTLSHSSSTLLSRTETYIQTLPLHLPSTTHMHIPRPVDFFSGQIHDLLPTNLHIRREVQTFRRLPKSGAIVLSTLTELRRLTDLSKQERREFLKEVKGWDEDVAMFKGRDLWITALEGWCMGRPVFRDDVTVFSTGE